MPQTAADLLAQAEHGSGHERVWLVTTSGKLLKEVEKEIGRQLPKYSYPVLASVAGVPSMLHSFSAR